MSARRGAGDRLAALSPARRQLLLRKLRQEGIDGAGTAAAAPPLRRLPRDGDLPLSFSQQRLWFLDRFQPGNNFYNLPAAYRLAGPLHIGALAGALHAIARRHEILRTTFDLVDGRPVQRIAPPRPLPIRRIGLAALPAGRREGAALAAAGGEGRRPFDLARGPLFRVTLIEIDGGERLLILNLHHIVADGWSIGVLLGELSALYGAALAGRPSPLPELPIQYADYAAWQRQILEGEELARQAAYWRQHLAGAPPLLELPADRPRPAVQSFRGRVCAFRFPAPLSRAVRDLCRRQDVTLFMTLLAGFEVLLNRLSGQEDVVVGIGVANRNRVETEPLIGFFINTLALRTDLSGNPTFAELLGRVRAAALAGYAHQDLPFEKLVEELRLERALDRNPVVQVAFVLQNTPMPPLDLRGAAASPVLIQTAAAKFDWLLSLTDEEPRLTGLLEFNSDLFDLATVERMLGQYQQLLAAFAADPLRRIRMVPLFAAEAARRLGLEPERLAAVAPLNTTQRDLFLDHARDPESVVYSLGVSARLPAAVDPRLWQQAWAAVTAAEPVTRLRILAWRGEPLQVEDRAPAPACEVVDLAAAPAWEELLARRVKVPYRLEAGGLCRGFLVRGLPQGDVALLAYHHIVADAYSGKLLLERTAAAYGALAAGRRPPAAPAGPPAFFAAVGDSLARFDTHAVRAFWAERLRHVAPVLPQPAARARAAARTAVRRVTVGPAELAELRRFAAERLSLAALLRAMAGALLDRLFAPAGDLLLHDVVGGRPREHAGTAGCFHQVVPVVFPRRSLGHDRPVADHLRAAREYRRQLGDAQYLSVLLERQLVKDEKLRFFYNFYNFAQLELLGGRTVLEVHDSFPADEVHLIVSDRGDEVMLSVWWHESSLPDLALPERLLAMALQAARGASRLGDLEVLFAAERRQIVVAWNATATAWPGPHNLQLLLEEQERLTPEAVAVASADEALSYRELHRRANRLAHLLRGSGVGPEQVVATAVERSLDMAVALVAVIKAGGAYLPLDPDYPAERLRYMLADSRAAVLLAGAAAGGGAALQDLGAAAAGVLDLGAPATAAALSRQPAAPPACRTTPGSLAYVIYTSGSTGRPKGTMNTHGGIVNRLLWMQDAYRLTAADRVLQKTPLSFDVSVWEVFWPLLTGACLVLARPEGHKDAAYLVRLIGEQGITTLHFVPAMLGIFLAQPGVEVCGSLRRVIASGEALAPELVERFWGRLPCELHNLYGPTEAAVDVSAWACRRGDRPAPVPIGRPIANTPLYVLDREQRPLPAGLAGELHIGGVQLARGYAGRPDLTAERFVPDPWTAGGRLYRTGDLARHRADGNLEYLGRIDQQVKLRGVRIEPGEIETTLGSLPEVRQALVVVRGETAPEQALTAYLVAAPGVAERPGHGELMRRMRLTLPDAMVPAHYVWLDELPLLPNGKVDRRSLPAPAAERPALDGALVAAQNDTERTLLGIWQEALGLPKVGATDNFFDLGGHSLLLVKVQTRVRESFGRELSMVELFRHPTVRALAGLLAPRQAPAAGPGAPAAAAGIAPPAVTPAAAGGGGAVAVIGMAGHFPRARDLAELWQRLRAGEELISYFSREELAEAGVDPGLLRRPAYVPAKAMLPDIDRFDAAFFGFSPREAEIIDPQQRLFLEAAWEALEDAGYDPRRPGGRVGVFAGQSLNTYLLWNVYPNTRLVESVGLFQAFLAADKDFLATRTSYKLGLKGPSVTVQTACSTSLVAVHMACRSLLGGECEMALAGGVGVSVPVKSGYLYQQGGIASPDGHCRPFDSAAQGTVPGNGLGIVVLKRLADAVRDGDSVRAVILGSAINNDGADKVGFTAPSVDGQVEVISEALARAGVGAETVAYVEAHGTGTPLGDPIEVAALRQVFAAAAPAGAAPASVALGSIKSNLGHLDAAAGIAGLLKAVLALEHGEIPPTANFATPNPALGLAASPFYVNRQAVPWPRGAAPRRAGVSSFGIGGTNAHVVLEEAPEALAAAGAADGEGAPAAGWPHLLVLSARTAPALAAAAADLAEHLGRHPGQRLADVAWTLQAGRRVFAWRQAVVCGDRAEAVAALRGEAPHRAWKNAEESAERPLAFLFPGQGTQHVAMAAGLYRAMPAFAAVIDRCAASLAPRLGLDLRQLLYPAPGREVEARRLLDRTAFTQPALFTVEIALAQLWMGWGCRPAAMLGHSIGELVAATVSGVLELEDALALVALRGELVDALPAGAMLSVALSEGEVEPLLGAELSLAAVNGPGLCVVAGEAGAVDALERTLAGRRVGCRRLHTSHAFHSHLVEPAVERFAEVAARFTFAPPRVPFVSGTTGTWITRAQAVDPWYWARHLRQPIRFAAGLQALAAGAAPALLEVGPGNSLAGLARGQLGESGAIVLSSLPHPKERGADVELMAETLGKLWLAGAAVDWAGYRGPAERRRVPLPTYPFERGRHWVEAPSAAGAAAAAAADGAATPLDAAPAPAEAAMAAAPSPPEAPRPAAAGALRLREYAPPEGELEQAVAAFWGELLGVAEIGRHDSFFELGGHSLAAVQLFSRLQERFPVQLPIDSLFEHPTLAAFAELLEASLLDRLEAVSDQEAASWAGEGALAAAGTLDVTPKEAP